MKRTGAVRARQARRKQALPFTDMVQHFNAEMAKACREMYRLTSMFADAFKWGPL